MTPEEVIEKHQGMVVKISRELYPTTSGRFNLDLEDLIQEGYIGLLEALERYDESRGVKFSTYAAYLVRGRIKDYLRTTDHLKRAHRKHLRESGIEEEQMPGTPIPVDMYDWNESFSVMDDLDPFEDSDVIQSFIAWGESTGRVVGRYQLTITLMLQGYSQVRIAKLLGVTESRIAQIVKRVMKEAHEYGRMYHDAA